VRVHSRACIRLRRSSDMGTVQRRGDMGSSSMAIWRMRRARAWVCRLLSLDVEGEHILLLRAWGDRGCKESWHLEFPARRLRGWNGFGVFGRHWRGAREHLEGKHVYFRDFYRKLTLDSWSFNASSLHFLGLFYSPKTLQCVSSRAPLKFLHVSADSLAHAAHDD
jgi:hypothetical protein